jgi:plasmid stabilization system protein ParE
MNGRVIRSDLALADLAEQSEYIRQHNPRTALRFLTAVEDTFRQLASLPGIGEQFETDKPVFRDLRSFSISQFRPFVVYFLRVVSAVLGSNLAQLRNDVCLHLLKRSEQLVKLFRAHCRSKREQGAAGKRSAAKGTLELHEAQAVMLDVLVTAGERLRQAAHRVTGALIEHAQRRSKSRVCVTKERI